jgi:hypothetical protein
MYIHKLLVFNFSALYVLHIFDFAATTQQYVPTSLALLTNYLLSADKDVLFKLADLKFITARPIS